MRSPHNRSASSSSIPSSAEPRRRGISASSLGDYSAPASPGISSPGIEPAQEKKRSRSLSKTASKGLKSISRSLRSISGSSASISSEKDPTDKSKKKLSRSSSSDPSADILRNPKKKPMSRQASSASIDREALKSSRVILPCEAPASPRDTIHFSTLYKKLANSGGGGELVMYVGPAGTPTSVTVKHPEDEVFELPPEPSPLKTKRSAEKSPIRSAVSSEARGAPEGSEGLVTEEVITVSDEEFEVFEKNEAFVDKLLQQSVPSALVNQASMKNSTSNKSHFSTLEKKRDETGEEININVEPTKEGVEKKKSDLQRVVDKSFVAEEMIVADVDEEVYEENESYLDQLNNETPKVFRSKIPRPVTEPQSPPPIAKEPPSKIPVPIGKRAPSPSPIRKSPPSPSPNPRRKSIDEKDSPPRRKSIDGRDPPRKKSIDEKEMIRRKSIDEKESPKITKELEVTSAKPPSTVKEKEQTASMKGKEKLLSDPTENVIGETINLLDKDLKLVEKTKAKPASKPKPVVEDEVVVGNSAEVYQENTFYDSVAEDSPTPSVASNSPRASLTEGRYDNMLDNISSIMKEMEEEKLLLALLSNVQREASVEVSHTPVNREEELEVRAGDVVQDIIHQENGWSEGELKGKRGIFPTSCLDMVEELYKTKPKVDAAIDRSEVEAAMKLTSLQSESSVSKASGKPKASVEEALQSQIMVEDAFEEPRMKEDENSEQRDVSMVKESLISVDDPSNREHLERMKRLNEAFDECLHTEPISEVIDEAMKLGEPKSEMEKAPEPRPVAKNTAELKSEIKKTPEPKQETGNTPEPKPGVKKTGEPKPDVKTTPEAKPEVSKTLDSKPE